MIRLASVSHQFQSHEVAEGHFQNIEARDRVVEGLLVRSDPRPSPSTSASRPTFQKSNDLLLVLRHDLGGGGGQ